MWFFSVVIGMGPDLTQQIPEGKYNKCLSNVSIVPLKKYTIYFPAC